MNKQFFYVIIMILILFGLPLSTNVEYIEANSAVSVETNTEIRTTETKYQLTLDEAVDIQANANASPITSLYNDTLVYVPKKNIRIIQPARLYGVTVEVKEKPKVDSAVAHRFLGIVPVYINDLVIGDMYGNNDLWYEIVYKAKKYYIHSSSIFSIQISVMHDQNVYEHPDEDAHVFGQVSKGDVMTVLDVQDNWYTIKYNYWRIPKKEDIRFYLDPNNTDPFQHIRLDATVGVSADQLDKVLNGKGILEGLGYAFVAGAERYKVNEAYLISHALLETGNGTSPLATGVEVGKNEDGETMMVTDGNREKMKHIKTTYNMYGIGAADSCPVECGAKTAYEYGWFTPEDAVTEGAEWVGKDYIYNDFHQNTLYKMKWNPYMADDNEWKQYATDIGWAEKQTTNIKAIYDKLDHPSILYDIPIYLDK